MKEHVAGTMMNIFLGVIILYSLLTSYFAIADFSETFDTARVHYEASTALTNENSKQ